MEDVRCPTREEILAAKDLKQEYVPVPEWGGRVLVRELTGAERDEYEQSLMDTKKVGRNTIVKPNFFNAKARMVVKCLIDEEGKRLFSDRDAGVLGTKGGSVLSRLVDIIQRLSGMTQEDIEELEKNSESGQSEDSLSD